MVVVSKRVQALLWLAWAVCFPVTVASIYYFLPPPSVSISQIDIGLLFVLMVMISLMPIMVNGVSLFIAHSLSLLMFLTFGLFMEMILVQVAIAVMIIRMRLRKEESYRIPLNSLGFLLTSIFSGSVYYLLGGTNTPTLDSFPSILYVFAYSTANILANHLILLFSQHFIKKQPIHIVTRDLIWELVTTGISLPIGLGMYFLYMSKGTLAILVFGIPIVSLSIVAKLYNISERINIYLQRASEIGHQLAERLNTEEVLDLFLDKISSLIKYDYALVLDSQETGEFKITRHLDQRTQNSLIGRSIPRSDDLLQGVWQTRKSKLISAWSKVNGQKKRFFLTEGAESIVCVPIVREQEIKGMLLFVSERKYAFEKYQLNIIEILSSYLAVALENARHYERTKQMSERCALTNLYNFRFFESLLEVEYNKLRRGEYQSLSLMLLDLDHFKVVNDTYGHQSGNEILCQFADRLKSVTEKKGVVARYGGEEFVILLPNVKKDECLQIGEKVRREVANRPFILTNSITDDRKLFVRITVSIGIATAPNDSEDPLILIRHADRAMYMGAKRAGRNRVAPYVK